MQRSNRSPTLLVLFLVLLLVLSAYSTAYFGLKQQRIIGNGEGYHRTTGYRYGGRIAELAFWPAEKLDRFLRPGDWGWKDDPQQLGIEFAE